MDVLLSIWQYFFPQNSKKNYKLHENLLQVTRVGRIKLMSKTSRFDL